MFVQLTERQATMCAHVRMCLQCYCCDGAAAQGLLCCATLCALAPVHRGVATADRQRPQ